MVKMYFVFVPTIAFLLILKSLEQVMSLKMKELLTNKKILSVNIISDLKNQILNLYVLHTHTYPCAHMHAHMLIHTYICILYCTLYLYVYMCEPIQGNQYGYAYHVHVYLVCKWIVLSFGNELINSK